MDFNVLITLAIAATLIIVVAALRRRLVFEIQALSLLLWGNPRIGIIVYAIIFLPGTLLHELSHWIMAEILQVPTGRIGILPSLESMGKGEERLGYVMTGSTGPFKSFLIGFAPLFTGITALVVLGSILNTLWLTNAPLWQLALTIYGLIVVSNSMIVSGADRRNWPLIVIIGVLIGMLVYASNVTMPERLLVRTIQITTRINQAIGLTIGLNLAMILISFAVRRGVEKLTNKRISRGREL